MSSKLRVGILGAGWAAESHATAFSKIPGVEVTALWSRTRARAEAMVANQGLIGAQVYDQWQELIARADVDIISITCAQWLRRDAILAAFDNGKHVLIEKPLSIELEDAHTIVDAAQKADTTSAICFTTRYNPGIQMARQIIQAGTIGRVINYQTQWRFGMTPKAAHKQWPWWTDKTGVLGGIGSHEFDRIRFVTGNEFRSVVGRVTSLALPDEPDYTLHGAYSLIATMSGESGGWLEGGLSTGEGDWGIFFNGEKGTLRVTNEGVQQQLLGEAQPTAVDIPAEYQFTAGEQPFQHCWNRLIGDFVEVVRGEERSPTLATLEDGLRSQQVIAAALRTGAEQHWVDVQTST